MPSASNSTTPYADGFATQYAKIAPPLTSWNRCEAGAQSRTVEDVVAQHQCDGVVSDVVGADHEGLRQPVRPILHRVADVDAELGTVAEQSVEGRGRRAAVVISRMSRMPAIISVDSG